MALKQNYYDLANALVNDLQDSTDVYYNWIDASNGAEFRKWMQENCPSSDIFPVGTQTSPLEFTTKETTSQMLFIVKIYDKKEQTLFHLKWGC